MSSISFKESFNKGVIDRYVTRHNGAVNELRRKLVLVGKIKEAEDKMRKALVMQCKRKGLK